MSAKPFREMITHHCQLKCYFWWPFSNFQFLTIHKLNMSGEEEWLKTLHWHEQVMYTSPVHVRGSKCKHIGRTLSYPQIQYVCIHYGDSFRQAALTCFLEMKHQTRKRGHELFLKCAMWNVGEFLFCKMKNIILLRTKIIIIIPCKSVAIPKHPYEVHKPNSTNINHTEMLIFELEICL